jgi:Zn-dependent peptidase ImmA (M78 family)
MKFEMNDRKWSIELVPQRVLVEESEDTSDKPQTYFGLTVFNQQKIYLWDKLSKEQLVHTLIHELMHCYIGQYISLENLTLDEEVMCELVSNSHFIIRDIVDNFKRKFGE